jgi:predicted phage-related endonuclease
MANQQRMAPPKYSIGGTAAAKVLGVSRYGGLFSAYKQIVSALDGEQDDTHVSFAMYRGAVMEDPIIDMAKDAFEKETGLTVVELDGSGVVRHADYPYIHATVDRVLKDESGEIVGILEVKTYDNSFGRSYEWGRDDYKTQVSHYRSVFESVLGRSIYQNYILVAQADQQVWSTAVRVIDAGGDISGLSSVIDISWREMETVENYNLNCLPKLLDFWETHIETRTPPMIDGTEDCSVHIMNSIPERSGVLKVSNDDLEYYEIKSTLEKIGDLESEIRQIKDKMEPLRAQEKDRVSEIDRLKNVLKKIIGDKKTMESDAFRVTVSRRRKSSSSIDKDKLKINHPEIYSSCLKEGSQYESVTIKIKDQ